MTYSRKRIDVRIQLGQGQFGESGFDIVDLKGLRCAVDIAQSGAHDKSPMQLRIWGLEQQLMNKLTRVGRIQWSGAVNNLVSVDVGDDAGMFNLYQGSIWFAQADFRAMPEAPFVIEAAAGWFDSIKPAPAMSYRGAADVAVMLQDIARRMSPPLAFVNHGVRQTLSNPALTGTLWDQLQQILHATRINASIDNGTLTIWPEGGDRGNDPIVVSSATGMVGYPLIGGNFIEVTTLVNPTIQVGAVLQIDTDILPAKGRWRVAQIAYNLASDMPDAPWFQTMVCTSPDSTDWLIQ